MKNPSSPSWRSIGFWLALALALSQISNAVRVAFGAQTYSAYMGLPLANPADAAWVSVYGLRALFMGCFAGYLLLIRQYRILSAMALFALVMPLGDFFLVWNAGGSTATLARHALIAVVLIAAWISLARMARAQPDATPL